MNYNKKKNKTGRIDEQFETVSRSEYRELLLARMAGGDLYAAETYRKVREADMMLDALREKPIYNKPIEHGK